ncbi:MAG: recombinase family protein, partial [Deltaproteobacteria bacterium]|nr:recombinase family protein [Deltaproteobacteria bacterium]
MSNEMPLRVGAYVRVSTTNQILAHDSSLDTQLERIRQREAYENAQAKQRKGREWRIVEVYREEGKSGKSTDREELQQLLDDVKSGHIEAVVVTKIDRITRSLVDFYSLWATFEEHNVEFISLDDNFDTSSATGRAITKMMLVFAELERERTSERTREKALARRDAGKWFGGPLPLGYQVEPENPTTLAVDESFSRIVQEEIFEKFLELGSARAVTRHLSKLGVKRPTRKTTRGGQTGGQPIATQAILRMLANPMYIAKRETDPGILIDCIWPPIVDEALYWRVQKKLAANHEKRPTGRKSLRVYLLEGLVKCGACGGTMTYASAGGRGGVKYFYYRCSQKHHTAQTACTVRDIPADALEEFVLGKLKSFSIDDDALSTSVREANDGRDVQAERLDIEILAYNATVKRGKATVRRLVDVVEDVDEEGLGEIVDRLRKRRTELKADESALGQLVEERAGLDRDLLNLEAVVERYRELPRVLNDGLEHGHLEEVRSVLRGLVESIVWTEKDPKGDEGWAEVHLFEPPVWLLTSPSIEEQKGKLKNPNDLSGSLGCSKWRSGRDS